jgi:hypothetical protein
MVTLIAVNGNDTKEFLVHKEFACHYSPTLNAAFNSTFIEGQTQTYRLEEFSEGVVRLLVQWLYTQNLDIGQLHLQHENKEITEQSAPEAEDENLLLAQLWVLADQLFIPKLQNLVINIFHEFMNDQQKKMPVNCYSYVYNNTSKESKLRLYLLHCCACYLSSGWYTKHADCFPKEMLLDLVTAHAEADDKYEERILRLEESLHIGDCSQYKVSEE